MRPQAHLQAVIELLGAVEDSNKNKGLPLDALIKAYFRKRRYAGSKDRRAVREMVFEVLRSYGAARWWAAQAGLPPEPRAFAIGHAALEGKWLEYFGAEGGFAPEPLTDAEQAAVAKLKEVKAPEWAQSNMPKSLYEAMQTRYAFALPSMLNALNKRAPLTLRINAAKTSFTRTLAKLKESDIAGEPGVFANTAIHVPEGTDLSDHELMAWGHIEVQDEASQLCAAMVTPPPGGIVVDLCAGAGGKALAIAAFNPKARILACDVSAKRLEALKARAERAGVTTIETVILPEGYPETPSAELDAVAGAVHQVLVDAPCGGSGTWRRHPEARWRYGAAEIATFAQTQLSLAKAGAALLRPGGRLTFATCSLLPEEGEAVYEALISAQLGLAAVDYRTQIHPKMVKKMPETLSNIKECLLLSPHIHGCDGFFAVSFKRAA